MKRTQQTDLRSYDTIVGAGVYSAAHSSRTLWVLAKLIAYSGDEAVWCLPAGFLATIVTVLNSFGGRCSWAVRSQPSAWCCAEQGLMDLFGTACTAAALECVAKLIFQRTRPEYAPQRKYTQGGASIPVSRT